MNGELDNHLVQVTIEDCLIPGTPSPGLQQSPGTAERDGESEISGFRLGD